MHGAARLVVQIMVCLDAATEKAPTVMFQHEQLYTNIAPSLSVEG